MRVFSFLAQEVKEIVFFRTNHNFLPEKKNENLKKNFFFFLKEYNCGLKQWHSPLVQISLSQKTLLKKRGNGCSHHLNIMHLSCPEDYICPWLPLGGYFAVKAVSHMGPSPLSQCLDSSL